MSTTFVTALLDFIFLKTVSIPSEEHKRTLEVFRKAYLVHFEQFLQLSRSDLQELVVCNNLRKEFVNSLISTLNNLRLKLSSSVEDIFQVLSVYLEFNFEGIDETLEVHLKNIQRKGISNGSQLLQQKSNLDLPIGVSKAISTLLSINEVEQLRKTVAITNHLLQTPSSTDLNENQEIEFETPVIDETPKNEIPDVYPQPAEITDRRYLAEIEFSGGTSKNPKKKYFLSFSLGDVKAKKFVITSKLNIYIKNVIIGSKLVISVHEKSFCSEEIIANSSLVMSSDYIGNRDGIEHPITIDDLSINIPLKVTLKEMDYFPFLKEIGTFNGNKFSVHSSNLGSILTSDITRLSTFNCYEIQLHHIKTVFGDIQQYWNKNYDSAQKIFNKGPSGALARQSIRAQHLSLYRDGLFRTTIGKIHHFNDFFRLLLPACSVYTYVITETSMRFSETSSSFFKDFMSKHASHANAKPYVRYSGEFHILKLEDRNVLVLDNNSGTYAPNAAYLPLLKHLFRLNFPGIDVQAYCYSDPLLKESLQLFRQQNESPDLSSNLSSSGGGGGSSNLISNNNGNNSNEGAARVESGGKKKKSSWSLLH